MTPKQNTEQTDSNLQTTSVTDTESLNTNWIPFAAQSLCLQKSSCRDGQTSFSPRAQRKQKTQPADRRLELLGAFQRF